MTNYKNQVLHWDVAALPMNDTISFLGQAYLTSLKMRKVVIHTAEPVSTRIDTPKRVKIIDITYDKSDLEHIAAN